MLPFEAWLRRGNLEHAKITALPRAYPPRNRRRKTIAQTAAAKRARKAVATSAARVHNSTTCTNLPRGTVTLIIGGAITESC